MNTLKRTPLIGLVCLLGACASIPDEQKVEHDPWESMNRSVYAFNDGLDKITTRPLAKGYQAITPSPVRKSISNFFRNLTTPRSIVNNFLQGKPGRGFSETGRFLLNSSIGIGGLFDVATAGGMEEYREDFGQTAAVWGVADGPYVVLPIFGPRTLRDAVTFPLDVLADPLNHYDETSVRDKLVVLRIIELRQRLLAAEQLIADSKDPYLTIRESYLQNREYEVFDGNPPEDDDFFDDVFEDEDY